jgi:glycosyltransferase involved in cell wall biosynthesis
LDNVATPLVTVYIPTHNRSKMVKAAIESVLSQSYQNLQIIVVDDGSTDDTKEVVTQFFPTGKVTYLQNETPLGACAARNKAIDMASGELITGLDDDDLFSLNRIEELVNCFKQGEFSCVTSGITERTTSGDIERIFDTGEVSLDKLLHKNILGNQVLTKTEYLQEIGGFDLSMPSFQDYDTWVRLVAKFGTAYKIKSSSYLWLTSHEAQRISTDNVKKKEGFEKFYQKHLDKMSASHVNTLKILRKRIFNERFSFFEFVTMTNRHNWRQSLTLFVERYFPWIKKTANKVRAR